MLPLAALLVALAPPPAAPGTAEAEAFRALARATAGEPTIAEVQRAAADLAGADDDQLRSWVVRPRTAAWLPRLSVEGSHTERDTRVIGVTGTVESDYLRLAPTTQVGVRLAWDLDRLIFARDEVGAAWTASRILDRREERVRRATKAYFQRRRLLLQLLLDPPREALARAERENQVDEVTAELDGLTGGLFSAGRMR
jgi:hypothetical protein